MWGFPPQVVMSWPKGTSNRKWHHSRALLYLLGSKSLYVQWHTSWGRETLNSCSPFLHSSPLTFFSQSSLDIKVSSAGRRKCLKWWCGRDFILSRFSFRSHFLFLNEARSSCNNMNKWDKVGEWELSASYDKRFFGCQNYVSSCFYMNMANTWRSKQGYHNWILFDLNKLAWILFLEGSFQNAFHCPEISWKFHSSRKVHICLQFSISLQVSNIKPTGPVQPPEVHFTTSWLLSSKVTP